MDKLIQQKFIDATPDEGYPLRILQAYRDDCNLLWSSTTSGLDNGGNELMAKLNEMQEKRAAILDRAIAAISQLVRQQADYHDLPAEKRTRT